MLVAAGRALRAVRNRGQERFFRFIDRKVQPQKAHRLTRNKLYIFPSKRGFALIGIILLLWLLGTNYQNNLVLGLAFLLSSVFIVAILQTHANLSSLKIEFSGVPQVFSGERANFTFSLSSGKRRYAENLEINWQNAADSVVNIDIPPDESIKVVVPFETKKRGWLKPARMRIQSVFPLGILRCWTWLNWDIAALVYPEPFKLDIQMNITGDLDGDGQHPIRGGEDYTGLKDYQPGDSLKHVAWKPFAQEKGLYVKEFSQNLSSEHWLNFDAVPAADPELRLSVLCYWALKYDLQDEYYGLKLPGREISPEKGENHRRQVLEALATF